MCFTVICEPYLIYFVGFFFLTLMTAKSRWNDSLELLIRDLSDLLMPILACFLQDGTGGVLL